MAYFTDEENHEEIQDSRLVGQTSKPGFVEFESHLPLPLHYGSTTSKCAVLKPPWLVTTRICSWLSCSMLMHWTCHSADNRTPILAATATTQSHTAYCLPDVRVCKGKAIPVQAVEVLMAVRVWGSHIFHTFGSQMGTRLSALRAGRLYLQETSWYSFLLEAEATAGPHSAAGRIK
jgi:hypothetical protein